MTETTISLAEELLSARFGGLCELTNPEVLSGSGSATVLRCRVVPNPFLQERSVVVKQLPMDDPADLASRGVTHNYVALVREIIAYQYTNTLPENARPGPLLLAHDIDNRILVLSDVGDGANFQEVLNYFSAEDRISALRKLGRAMGRMHAHTFGDSEAFGVLYRRQCSRHNLSPAQLAEYDLAIPSLIRGGMALMERNGIAIDPVIAELAEYSAEANAQPGFQAFTPFDLIPDNIMLAHNVVFLDYEWANFRDVTFDVACVVAGFPQDNSTPALSTEEAREFIGSWRAEIAPVWPEIRDDELLRKVIIASMIGWAFTSLMLLYYGRLALEEHADSILRNEQQNSKAHLEQMSKDNLEDIATTVDAIRQFAVDQPSMYTEAVVGYATTLREVLSKLGAFPRIRRDPA